MKKTWLLLVPTLSACGSVGGSETTSTPAEPPASSVSTAPSPAEVACIDKEGLQSAIDDSVALTDAMDYEHPTEVANALDALASEIDPVYTDVADEFRAAAEEFHQVEQYLDPLKIVKVSEAWVEGAKAYARASSSLSRSFSTEDVC